MKLTKLLAALLIAVGILGLGLCVRSGLKTLTASQRTVEVRGLATREVPANKVTWPIVFTQTGNDLPAVYAAVTATNEKVVKFLVDNGVDQSQISVGAPSMTDLSTDRYNTNPIPYKYSLTSVVTVSSDQVDKVRKLINRQGELLQQGIPIAASDWQHQVSYEYTGLNDIKPEMIAEATRNARDAAMKFAADSESEVGKIMSARQGQFTIEDRDANTPYIKEVRVVTTLTYYLDD